jgi:anti-sigma factor RsiW
MSEGKSVLKKLRDWMFRSVPGMLTCKEVDDDMADYIDAALPAKRRRKFTLHLLLCTFCRRYLRAYRRTIALCADSALEPDRRAEDELPEALVESIISASRSKPERE